MAEIGDLDVTDGNNTARFPELQAASTVNNGARALEGLLARGLKDIIDGTITTAGSSTAYTAAANRTITSYYDGLMMAIELHTASGASPTLNVDSVGAQALVFPDGTAVAANDLPSGAILLVKYDLGNTRWVVMTSPNIATAASLGLVIGTDVQAWDTDLDAIAALTKTKGDLIVTNGSVWSDLAVGSNDQVLTADSAQATGVKWATPSNSLPSPDFTSSEQTVTASTTLNVAHSLGALPTLTTVSLRNKTTEYNYSINDEVFFPWNDISGATNGVTFVQDTTNVTILQGNTIRVQNKTTPTSVSNITVGNWKWIVRAWA